MRKIESLIICMLDVSVIVFEDAEAPKELRDVDCSTHAKHL